jgi:hypothetical protein
VKRIVALTTDLMDRSRISATVPDVEFGDYSNADVVIVDIARGAEQVGAVRSANPAARIVCYGPHVDDAAAEGARAAGADVVMARSRFFRDPAGAVG